MLHVDEAIVDLAIERGVTPFLPGRPAPTRTNRRSSRDRRGRGPRRRGRRGAGGDSFGNHIDLGAPAVIERRAGSEKLLPLVVGQVALDAVVEGDWLVVRRANFVPGKRAMMAPFLILALDLLNHGGAGENGVLVLAGGEAEVAAEEAGIFGGEVVGEVGKARAVVGVVVLAGDGGLAGDGVEKGEKGAGFRSGVGVYGLRGRLGEERWRCASEEECQEG